MIGATIRVYSSLMKYFFSRYSLIFFSILFLILFIPPVPFLKWGRLEVIHWDKEKGKLVYELYKGSSRWFPIEKISQMTLSAIIVAEDARFYKHDGIDLNSIFLSIKQNYRAGYIKGGASTITQQVVRLAFLNLEKSYLRKLREIMGALLLELILTKEEILAWYLNLAYFGSGFIGIEEASQAYFQTNPTHLNLNQSIQLALVLPSPNTYRKQLSQKKLEKNAQKRFYFILKELKNNNYISERQWHNAHTTGNFGNPIWIEKNKK